MGPSPARGMELVYPGVAEVSLVGDLAAETHLPPHHHEWLNEHKRKSCSWGPEEGKSYFLRDYSAGQHSGSVLLVLGRGMSCNDIITSLLNCWPLQCLNFRVTPLWRALFTQACLPSCRSFSRVATVRSWI